MTNLEKLKEMTAIQCTSGNWNYDEYMHGMANGMIYALALMENVEPIYKDAPKAWLRDIKLTSDSESIVLSTTVGEIFEKAIKE